jgi:hypothetical protein
LLDDDFFRLLKNEEGFLAMTGWFSLFADKSAEARGL